MDQINFIYILLAVSVFLNGYLIHLSLKRRPYIPNPSETQNPTTDLRKSLLNFLITTNEKIYDFTNFLHSELGGTLSSIKLQLSHVQYLEEEKNNTPNPKLTEIINHLSEIIRSISLYSYRLIPGSLLQVGIESALQSYIKRASLNSSTKLSFHKEGEFPSFSKDESIGLFLIISEYLNLLIDQSWSEEISVVSNNNSGSFKLQITAVIKDQYIEHYYSEINMDIIALQAEVAHATIDFNTSNRTSPCLSILYKNSLHKSI